MVKQYNDHLIYISWYCQYKYNRISMDTKSNILEPPDKIIQQKELGSSKGPYSKDKLVKKLGSICDVYSIDMKLGAGSFGSAFLVTHKQLKAKHVVKIIKKSSKPALEARVGLEALKRLDHPNIIKLVDYYETKDRWFIATQSFFGYQLFDQIINHGLWSEEEAAKLINQVLKALAYIHSKQTAHGDIKAESIIMRKGETGYVIKLIDWGLSILTIGEDLYRKCGEPQYCAPQVFSGHANIECDMWSLGVLTYLLLSGTLPFKGANINETTNLIKKGEVSFQSSAWHPVSQQAKDFILHLLQKDIPKRATAAQCLESAWIKDKISKQNKEANLQGTLEKLKFFRNKNRLHIIMVNYILNLISAKRQIQRLKQQFERMDNNKKGVIKFEELLTVYKQIYGVEADLIVEGVLKRVDLDSSKSISLNQFLKIAELSTFSFNKEQLKSTFQMFGLDKDAQITNKELRNLILHQRRPNQHTQFDSIINEIDISNDEGKIDLQEFINKIQQASAKNQVKTKQQWPIKDKVSESKGE